MPSPRWETPTTTASAVMDADGATSLTFGMSRSLMLP
jgi:hypothetical protein